MREVIGSLLAMQADLKKEVEGGNEMRQWLAGRTLYLVDPDHLKTRRKVLEVSVLRHLRALEAKPCAKISTTEPLIGILQHWTWSQLRQNSFS